MHESQSIWIKTSLVEQNAPKPKRLNNDTFIEEENQDNDWGWIKGSILNENEQNNTLTIRITDEESIYNNSELTTSNTELQNGIVIANIHNDENDYYSSSSSLESSIEREEENFHKSYPNDLTNLIHLHEPAILHV